MSAIIKAENIGKKYIIGHNRVRGNTTFRDLMTGFGRGMYERFRHPLSINKELVEQEDFWALKDINFEIEPGDRVGIIGRNGSGKSTLLKVLSRITTPTTGRVQIKGRVASLLEVGTGFHPELSGRENIYLNGAILGMKRAEIKKKFDEIVDFSGVEKFLDTPVKRYSSGMYVRLAFAVAAHLEPEILLVDEVLAVGDAEFQKKCLGKMEDISKGEGRTILFVSHNMGAVSSLCQKAILLKSGNIMGYAETDTIISQYFSGSNGNFKNYTDTGERFCDDFSELLEASIRTVDGKDEITLGDSVRLVMSFRLYCDIDGIVVPNFGIYTEDQITVLRENARNCTPLQKGVYRAEWIIPGYFFNNITYTVGIALSTLMKHGAKNHFFDKAALLFSVKDLMGVDSNRYGYVGKIPGVIRPAFTGKIEKLS